MNFRQKIRTQLNIVSLVEQTDKTTSVCGKRNKMALTALVLLVVIHILTPTALSQGETSKNDPY